MYQYYMITAALFRFIYAYNFYVYEYLFTGEQFRAELLADNQRRRAGGTWMTSSLSLSARYDGAASGERALKSVRSFAFNQCTRRSGVMWSIPRR